jgi:hypothetical protein
MTRAAALPTVLALLLAGDICTGCASQTGPAKRPGDRRERVTITFHLAYDEPQDGLREMKTKDGRQMYVSPLVELDQTDIAAVRALRSDRRPLLQISLTPVGTERLYYLTATNYQRTKHSTQRVGPLIDFLDVQVGVWLAVLVNDELAGVLPITAPVTGGHIYLVDMFSARRTEQLADLLDPPPEPP